MATTTITSDQDGPVYGGQSNNDNVNDETIEINNASINGTNGHVYGGYSENNVANSNKVYINNSTGKTISGNVYGGHALNIAKDNTVNILTAIALKNVYGGVGYESENNTLNIFAKNVTVNNVCYSDKSTFQNMNFFLPRNTAAGDTMLTINSDTNLTGVNFGLAAQSGLKLKVGDTITLITTGSNGSDDVTIHSNLNDERYHFDSVDSSRIRLGFRYHHPLNEKSKLPLGLFPQGLASRRTRREILTRRLLVVCRPHLWKWGTSCTRYTLVNYSASQSTQSTNSTLNFPAPPISVRF